MRNLAGIRDRLIHNYFGVDYTIVWDVATTKLTTLRGQLQALLDLTEGPKQEDPCDPVDPPHAPGSNTVIPSNAKDSRWQRDGSPE